MLFAISEHDTLVSNKEILRFYELNHVKNPASRYLELKGVDHTNPILDETTNELFTNETISLFNSVIPE